jgi:hypothetical protein
MSAYREENGYRFDAKFDWWTKDHYTNYEWVKRHFSSTTVVGTPLTFAEVGVFEGRSTIWFVENVIGMTLNGRPCFPDSVYHCIEPDPAPNFDHNIALLQKKVPHVRVSHHKEYSEHFLPKLIGGPLDDPADCPRLDFGYLDGDHNAQGVLRDAVMMWELLKVGGIMLFDDYEMEATDPWHYISHKEFKDHPRANFRHPSHAIDAFLNVYHGLYEVVIDNFQIGIIKKVHLGAKNIGHGDSTQGKFEYHAKKE